MPEKPSDETLREVRGELVGEVVEQARNWGVPVPSVRDAEKFVDPIMRKVEVDSEREANAIAKPDVNKKAGPGEWYGEKDHSPQIGVSSLVQDGGEVRSEELGEYRVGKDGKLTPLNGAPMPKPPTVLELVIKKLLTHPQWREQILAATKLCDKHLHPKLHCVLCERREARLSEIVWQAKNKLTKQRERRIMVGGK